MNLSLVEQVKVTVTIEDILREHGILPRRGRCRCPVHRGDNPTSFSVKDSLFYCFACGVSGDVITLAQLLHGYDFRQALEFLCKKAGLEFDGDFKKIGRSGSFASPMPDSYHKKREIQLEEEAVIALERVWIALGRQLEEDFRNGRIPLVDYYTRRPEIDYWFEQVDECFQLVHMRRMKLKDELKRKRTLLPRD